MRDINILLIQSKADEDKEIVIVNGAFLGFIHASGGTWDLEIVDEHWDDDVEGTSLPECYEQTRQGIIRWIRRHIKHLDTLRAHEKMKDTISSPEVLTQEQDDKNRRGG